MRAVSVDELSYDCSFACIYRHDPAPTRAAATLVQALEAAHA